MTTKQSNTAVVATIRKGYRVTFDASWGAHAGEWVVVSSRRLRRGTVYTMRRANAPVPEGGRVTLWSKGNASIDRDELLEGQRDGSVTVSGAR